MSPLRFTDKGLDSDDDRVQRARHSWVTASREYLSFWRRKDRTSWAIFCPLRKEDHARTHSLELHTTSGPVTSGLEPTLSRPLKQQSKLVESKTAADVTMPPKKAVIIPISVYWAWWMVFSVSYYEFQGAGHEFQCSRWFESGIRLGNLVLLLGMAGLVHVQG